MNTIYVKQEEVEKVTIPRSISFNQHHKQKVVISKEMAVVYKFLSALGRLQAAQTRQTETPLYPFVLQFSYHEFLVHLGEHKVQLTPTAQVPHMPQRPTIQYYSPNPSSPTPTIKLPIHKKREVRLPPEQKDTKNIPKNYCKAIITFACKNQGLCFELLQDQLKVVKFIEKITVYKKQLLNIKIFSSLLQHSEDPEEEEFRKTFRILSQLFIKRYAINYIFNSKIVQHNWHMRYRQQIYKGVRNPGNFSHIKNL